MAAPFSESKVYNLKRKQYLWMKLWKDVLSVSSVSSSFIKILSGFSSTLTFIACSVNFKNFWPIYYWFLDSNTVLNRLQVNWHKFIDIKKHYFFTSALSSQSSNTLTELQWQSHRLCELWISGCLVSWPVPLSQSTRNLLLLVWSRQRPESCIGP